MLLRSWNLAIQLEPDGNLPLFLQIARAIAGHIRAGRLRPGDAVPGSRTLARNLGVHRNTVLASYDELQAEGWLVTAVAGGTFVAEKLPTRVLLSRERPPTAMADGSRYPLAPALPFERPAAYPPGTLILAKGAPDVRLLPTTEFARAYRRVLLEDGQRLLTYGDPAGHPRLRSAVAAMLSATRGIAATPETVMVTRGSQMALDLASRALICPGDVVAVEALGHPGAWNAFRLAGAELAPIPTDHDGLCVDALSALLERQAVRAVYVTPHHQFPTTTVMPAARRKALLSIASSHRVAIIEDDYDHEFHYDGKPVLPLASSDTDGSVLYIGTLSKILAPGLRAGFVVAPAPVIARLTSLRVASDLQGDLVTECALAELFENGELGRHVRRMRETYRGRRDALVAALRHELGAELEFEVPSGGMALWARVREDIDIDDWARRALAHGVAFRAGRMYDFQGARQPYTRLGFTYHDEGELAVAARRMVQALEASRRHDATAPRQPVVRS
jgi:GntR family transcriptional regulator/MocR family aminotransferase